MSGQFSVSINGREFPVACDKGEEERIKTLATYVDEKARNLTKKMGGRVNDLHILVLVSLTLADELIEILEENERFKQGVVSPADEDNIDITDPKFAQALSLLASRMEKIAGTLEGN